MPTSMPKQSWLATCSCLLLAAACATAPAPAAALGTSTKVHLLGRFRHPASKPELTTLLHEHGIEVVRQLEVGITVLVGGDLTDETGAVLVAVDQMADYRRASELGCELVPMARFDTWLAEHAPAPTVHHGPR